MYGLKCMISSIQSNFSRTRYMNQNISLLILLLSHFCSLYHNINLYKTCLSVFPLSVYLFVCLSKSLSIRLLCPLLRSYGQFVNFQIFLECGQFHRISQYKITTNYPVPGRETLLYLPQRLWEAFYL